MKTIYHASFSIGTSEEKPKLEEVLTVLDKWLSRRIRKSIAFQELGEESDLSFPDASVNVVKLNQEDRSLFSLALEHADREDPDFKWRTVFCLKDEELEPHKVSVKVSNGWADGILRPDADYKVSRPLLVPMLAQSFDCHNAYPIKTEPQVVTIKDVRGFADLLFEPNRTLPLVFISCTNFSDRPIVDPKQIADTLTGLAHVFVARDRFTSFKMEDIIGKSMNCYNGAVRIYWPIKPGQKESIHPLFSPQGLTGRNTMRGQLFHSELLEKLAKYSISRRSEISYEDILRLKLENKVAQLAEQREFGEIAEVYSQENEKLQKEIEAFKKSERELLEKVQSLEVRVSHLQQVLDSAKEESTDVEEASLVIYDFKTVKDAVEAFKQIYSEDRVLILGRAEAGAKNCLYEDPKQVFQGLEWLATTYRSVKSGELREDLIESCFKQTGLHYKPNQSPSTMGRFENEYFVTYEGQRRALSEHMRKGNSKDPRYTISIAFFYDKPKNKVVVGFIGQHQSTDAT
ncbi:hypothetical protein HZA97_00440 [Candidatus Woesearchaeota archaeon]|nr:hypothetical protein [Candidatus Woesearchaeota archaeon]